MDATGDEQIRLPRLEHNVFATAWSADEMLATAGDGPAIKLWRDDTIITSWNHEGKIVLNLAWSPTGLLAAACDDGSVRCWDPNGQAKFVLKGVKPPIRAVAWSPAGNLLAAGGAEAGVFVWTSTGEKVAEWHEFKSIVNAVAFSPDAARLAAASNDGTVRIWDLNNEQAPAVLQVGRPVHQVAWNPVTQDIITIADDRVLRIWDGESLIQKKVYVLLGDGGYAAFSAGGQLLESTETALQQLVRLSESQDTVLLNSASEENAP